LQQKHIGWGGGLETPGKSDRQNCKELQFCINLDFGPGAR